MPSQIDPSRPVDGVDASKAAERLAWETTKAEMEHGGFFTAPGAGAVEGTTAARLREFPRMADYGSDLAALDKALAAHDMVVIPPGIWTGTPTVMTSFSGKTILAPGAVLRPTAPLEFDGCSNITWIGGEIDGNSGAHDEGMRIDGCTDMILDDVHFHDLDENALLLLGTSDRITLRRCLFEDNGNISTTAAATDYLTKGSDIRIPSGGNQIGVLGIIGCRFRNAGGHSFHAVLDGGSALLDFTYQANSIDNPGIGGVIVDGATGIGRAMIGANDIKNCGATLANGSSATFARAVSIENSADAFAVVVTYNAIDDVEDVAIVAEAVVSMNKIHHVGANIANLGASRGGVSPDPFGIKLLGGEAYGNGVIDIAEHAIYCAASDVTIKSNVVHGWGTGSGADAIFLASCLRSVITQNVLYGIGQAAGDNMIQASGSNTTTVITDNVGFDCATISASGATLDDNRLDGVAI